MDSLVSRRLIVRPWFVLVAGISGGSISKRVLLAEAQLRPFEAERASERDFSRRNGGSREARAPGGFMNCPNNLLSVIFNGAQIESDLSTMLHCGWQASPAQAECAP